MARQITARGLETLWKRAQVNETVISHFRSNPPEKLLHAGRVMQMVHAVHGPLTRRHERAVREEVANLSAAARTVRKAQHGYCGKPGALYYALYGRHANVRLHPGTTLAITFIAPSSEININRTQKASGIAYRLPAKPGESAEGDRLEEARRRVEERLNASINYLAGLSTLCENEGTTPRHEEDHVISAILEAHRRFRGAQSRVHREYNEETRAVKPPRFEEAYAHWPHKTPDNIADLLAGYYGVLQDEHGRRIHALYRRIVDGRVQAEQAGEAVAEARTIGVTVPRGTADPLGKLAEELQEILYAKIGGARRDLNRIKELQERHGLSDGFIQSLLRTNDLKTAIAAIEHNAGEPHELPHTTKA